MSKGDPLTSTYAFRRSVTALLTFGAFLCCTGIACANPIYWADWTTQGTVADNPGSFVGYGTITTPSSTVDVTYPI